MYRVSCERSFQGYEGLNNNSTPTRTHTHECESYEGLTYHSTHTRTHTGSLVYILNTFQTTSIDSPTFSVSVLKSIFRPVSRIGQR